MIEINNLYKSFGNKHVLKGVDITVENGSTHCIIGKSGSGKSVLLKHIVGLLKPDKGNVVVDGKDIQKLSYKELFEIRKSMGFVLQGAALFDSYNVYENIVIGLYEHGEVIFVRAEEEKVSCLVIGSNSSCSLFSNIDKSILKSSITELDPAILLSAMQLSLAESII